MGRYVDGFVIPIKKKNLGAYKKMAKLGCKAWMKHGALDYYECVGQDMKNTWGLPFPRLCKLKSDETAIFSFIVYKSKAHRDQVNKKVHKEFADMSDMKMPFDTKKMTMGGFKVMLNQSKK
ncbi:MAG: DUF1428 domain-containing protein [Pseudobdellovibrionaceae bacterium]